MSTLRIAAVLAASSVLAGCGGGSDGGAQGPGSIPLSPPPSNATITNLVASQSFTNDDSLTSMVLALPDGTTSKASASRSTLAISYDAATKSYTVSTAGRSQTFMPTDQTTSYGAGISTFQKNSGGTSDYLTLATTPFDTSASNRYVGLGFWQRNQSTGGQQNSSFDVFTYGLETPASAMPRTGSASFAIDAFGLFTSPGATPQTLQGTGTFDVDLKSGLFASSAMMSTWDVVTGKPLSTGYIPLLSSGHLSGTDGSFSGNLSFSNALTSGYETVAGSIDGHFYGPSGQEIGATFAASNANGATLNGGFTGQQSTGNATQNLALTNLVVDQHFYPQTATMTTFTKIGGQVGSVPGNTIGQLQLSADGNLTFDWGMAPYGTINWGAANQIPGAANFTSYRTVVDGHPVELAMYKPGSANSELALTYTSFGLWRVTGDASLPTNIYDAAFVYGIQTTDSVLMNRTGSGHYDGVAYGAAFDSSAAAHYALTGTSSFDVNFSSQSYSGALALKGAQDGTGASRDFGTLGVSGKFYSNGSGNGAITQAGASIGQFTSQFYGPNGEEFAGTFTTQTANVSMAGVAAAKAR